MPQRKKKLKHTYIISYSLIAQLVKIRLQCRKPRFDSWVGKIPWRRDRLPTPVFSPGEFHGLHIVHEVAKSRTRLSNFNLGFPCNSDGKAFACNAGDLDSIPGLGRSPGDRNGNPLQYSCLKNSMDRGAG